MRDTRKKGNESKPGRSWPDSSSVGRTNESTNGVNIENERLARAVTHIRFSHARGQKTCDLNRQFCHSSFARTQFGCQSVSEWASLGVRALLGSFSFPWACEGNFFWCPHYAVCDVNAWKKPDFFLSKDISKPFRQTKTSLNKTLWSFSLKKRPEELWNVDRICHPNFLRSLFGQSKETLFFLQSGRRKESWRRWPFGPLLPMTSCL